MTDFTEWVISGKLLGKSSFAPRWSHTLLLLHTSHSGCFNVEQVDINTRSSSPVLPTPLFPSVSSSISPVGEKKDNKYSHRSSCNEDATSKNLPHFVLIYPFTHRARLRRIVSAARSRLIISGEAVEGNHFFVCCNRGLGFGLVLCWGEEAEQGRVSVLESPHKESLQVDLIKMVSWKQIRERTITETVY